jgi:hypothetical protein
MVIKAVLVASSLESIAFHRMPYIQGILSPQVLTIMSLTLPFSPFSQLHEFNKCGHNSTKYSVIACLLAKVI